MKITIFKMKILKCFTQISNQKLSVFGNLPYNISSQILFKAIENYKIENTTGYTYFNVSKRNGR